MASQAVFDGEKHVAGRLHLDAWTRKLEREDATARPLAAMLSAAWRLITAARSEPRSLSGALLVSTDGGASSANISRPCDAASASAEFADEGAADPPVALFFGPAVRFRQAIESKLTTRWEVREATGTPEEWVKQASAATVLVGGLEPANAVLRGVGPNLRLLQCHFTGVDWLDRSALPPHVALCNAVGMETPIAEWVLSAMLQFTVSPPTASRQTFHSPLPTSNRAFTPLPSHPFTFTPSASPSCPCLHALASTPWTLLRTIACVHWWQVCLPTADADMRARCKTASMEGKDAGFAPPFFAPEPPEPGHERSAFRPEVCGKTVGIVGYGKIGSAIAARAASFGCTVVATVGRAVAPSPPPEGLAWMDGRSGLERLLAVSDFVVLACPLNEATRGLVGAAQLRCMKSTAVLINIARGGVVDEAALYQALTDRVIAGAALDVWWGWPQIGAGQRECAPYDLALHPFHTLSQVIMSNHTSGWSDEQLNRRHELIAGNLDRVARGQPLRSVVIAADGPPSPSK